MSKTKKWMRKLAGFFVGMVYAFGVTDTRMVGDEYTETLNPHEYSVSKAYEAPRSRTPVKREVAESMELKLLVLDFDPVLHSRGVKMSGFLSEMMGGNQGLERPAVDVAGEMVDRLREASHGILNYNIQYEYLDEFPKYKDGLGFSEEEFVNAWEDWAIDKEGNWWSYVPEKLSLDKFRFDYEYYIEKLDLVNRSNKGEFDEILMSLEFGQGDETAMVGRGAYWINGAAIEADCKPFRINSIGKHRDDTPLENLGHSMEWILSAIYGNADFEGKKNKDNRTTWDKFIQIDRHFPGQAAVGNVHCAPNSLSGYDWGIKTYVYSTWRDWRDNYPNLTGQKTRSNADDWGNGNNLDYQQWWFSCMPHVKGRDEQGFSHNWWDYYANLVYTKKLDLYIDNAVADINAASIKMQRGETYSFKIIATH